MSKTKYKRVFVDIDTQCDFIEPEGALYVSGAETLKPVFAKLFTYARAHHIPVIASADAHAIDDPEFKQFPPHCVKGTPGQQKVNETQLHQALVIPNHKVSFDLNAHREVLIEKTVFDIFGNPNTESIFQHYLADEYIVFGVATDYCVCAAALGLRQRNFPVTLLSDAIAAVTQEGDTEAKQRMLDAGIVFKSTQEILGVS